MFFFFVFGFVLFLFFQTFLSILYRGVVGSAVKTSVVEAVPGVAVPVSNCARRAELSLMLEPVVDVVVVVATGMISGRSDPERKRPRVRISELMPSLHK